MMINTQDFTPSSELLSQFYTALQTGLNSGDQVIYIFLGQNSVNTKFFFNFISHINTPKLGIIEF